MTYRYSGFTVHTSPSTVVANVTWTTTDPDVAWPYADGYVSGNIPGTTTISAKWGELTANASLTVTKGTPTVYGWGTASPITYGQPLAASTLAGVWTILEAMGWGTGTVTWTTPTAILPAGTHYPEVIYTPADTVRFNQVYGTMAVNVLKATPTVTWPTASPVAYGQPLSVSTLTGGAATSPFGPTPVPGTFTWDAPATTLGPVGSYTQSVTFTPDDLANYVPVTGTVAVVVNKAVAQVAISSLRQAYAGAALTPTASTNPINLKITWTGASQTAVGSYPVTATVDEANYEGSASATFVITASDTMAPPTSMAVSPANPAITYGQTQAFTATRGDTGAVFEPGRFVSVTNGTFHSCGLLAGGTVECWGGNQRGQLGGPSSETCGSGSSPDSCSTTPVAVPGLTGRVVSISAGWMHTCAVLEDTTVQCWGHNNGMLGNGVIAMASPAVAVAGLSGVTAVSAGYKHTCALLADGTVSCWGQMPWYGTTGFSLTPAIVSGLSGVTAISAGQSHTCALLGDGTVKCWGNNDSGQLGTGSTATSSPTPSTVAGLAGPVTALSAGGAHTCALLESGAVQCWGTNREGELGDGTLTGSTTPVTVSGLESVTAIVGLPRTLARSRPTAWRDAGGRTRTASWSPIP